MPEIAARDARHDRLPGLDATPAQLLAARRPCERGAALTLAMAQRNLAIARSYTPEQLADEPRLPGEPWVDAKTAYVAWLERMLAFEAFAREDAARSVAAGYRFDLRADRAAGPLAEVVATALRRARTAIMLMSGPDADAAAAARRDVLRDWDDDDRLALLGAGTPPRIVEAMLGPVASC